ncbi:menaquinone biosynthetic enzyme MqnA/MqnD family protein [Herpetosiphon llansteffanensis]
MLGVIDYLNTQPLDYGITERLPHVPVQRGVPTAINAAVLRGEVAVAPMSVYEWALNADKLLVVRDFSIATIGAVNSVNLFSWAADPRQLDGQPIALTTDSATSVNLLKVLCERHYRIQPEWRSMAPNLDAMLAECQGSLMIGDKALVEATARRHLGERGLPYFFDLGDEWLKLSGLPFVFAVWVVRRDQADAVRDARIVPALRAAKAENLTRIDELAQFYAPRINISPGVCAKYLRDLRYHLTSVDLEGLHTFLRYAVPSFQPSQLEWFSE